MTYRAIFCADIHAGNQLPWAVKNPDTLITDRLTDIMDVLSQMSGYALDKNIQDIWILGDLIDRRLLDAVTLKLVTEELLTLKRDHHLNIRLVPGNHEAHDAACKHFTLDAFSSMGFWVAGQHGNDQVSFEEPVDGFEVVAIPYLPAARAEQLLNDHPGHRPSLLLLHQTIKGGMVGGWTSPDGLEPAMLEEHASLILSGHFHTAQSITENVHYLGAPVQHTFADAGEHRGFWDIEWGWKTCKRTMIPIHRAPQFYELTWKLGEEPPKLDGILPESYVNVKFLGKPTVVDKQWAEASRWCDAQRVERGLRLLKLTPVKEVESKQRLKLDDGERPSWDKVLSLYLDSADCTGLNRQKLEQLGQELLSDAER